MNQTMMTREMALQAKDSAMMAIKAVIARKASPGQARAMSQDLEDLTHTAIVKVIEKYDDVRATELMISRNESNAHAVELGIAINARQKWQTASPVGALAYVVGFNVAMDYLRGRATVRTNGKESVTLDAPLASGDDDSMPESLGDITPSKAPSAFSVTLGHELATWLADEIGELTPAQRDALLIAIDSEDNLTGSVRINKMRAINKIVANLPKAMRPVKEMRSKHKGTKRA